MTLAFDRNTFRQELAEELTGNIFPFRVAHVVDREHGGFYNAYQLNAQGSFAQAAHHCWSYINSHLVDPVHGDWLKQRSGDGTVDRSVYKAGPWECPYHHSRACFEMLHRLAGEPYEIRSL
jgi:mannose/cellobiose epimerase-like protein (N-acyl-D-glucosamine 2-epimerase family)